MPTLTDVPMPTNYEGWEEYEDLKSLHQRDLKDYERKEKLFPVKTKEYSLLLFHAFPTRQFKILNVHLTGDASLMNTTISN